MTHLYTGAMMRDLAVEWHPTWMDQHSTAWYRYYPAKFQATQDGEQTMMMPTIALA